MFVDMKPLGEQGFSKERGENFYRVCGYVDLYGDQDGLDIKVTIMKYGYEYPEFGEFHAARSCPSIANTTQTRTWCARTRLDPSEQSTRQKKS